MLNSTPDGTGSADVVQGTHTDSRYRCLSGTVKSRPVTHGEG